MKYTNQQGKLAPAVALLIIFLIGITALLAYVAASQKKELKSRGRAANELQIPGLGGKKLLSRSVHVRIDNVTNLTGFGINVELKAGIPKEAIQDIRLDPFTEWFPLGEELSENKSADKISYIRTTAAPGVSGEGEVVRISYTAPESIATNPFEVKGVSLVFGEGVSEYLKNFQCPTAMQEEASTFTISGPGKPCE